MFSLPRVLVPLVLSLVWIGAESHAAVTTKKSNAKLTVKGDDANDAIILGGSGALGDVQVMVDGLLVAEFTGIRDIDVRTEGGATIHCAQANLSRLVDRPITWGDQVWLRWAPGAGVVLLT